MKNEFYTRKAHEDKYPARSVYKLQEIDKKFNLIKKGDRVLDLGCAPGSWLMYLSKKVSDKGRVIGIDVLDIKIKIPQNVIFLKKDVMSFVPTEVEREKYEVVVSDLAPSTSGIEFVDAER